MKPFLMLLIPILLLLNPHLGFGSEILHVGSSKRFTFDNAQKIEISKRGVIHLLHIKDDQWDITALRSGVVTVLIKKKNRQTETKYFDIRPRDLLLKSKNRGTNPVLSVDAACKTSIHQSYRVTISIEEHHQTISKSSNGEPQVKISSPPKHAFSINLESGFNMTPQESNYERNIVSDPIILTQPCVETEVRAGGEEERLSQNDSGHTVSTWRDYGVFVRFKIEPNDQQTHVSIPFHASLKGNSSQQDQMGLSEVQSAIYVKLGVKQLAAIVNIDSQASTSRSPLLLTEIPIIGPLLKGFNRGSSHSKLYLYFLAELYQEED